ncbi:MAG: molybdopterin-binding protein [Dehalococcoidia bacterium]|nr:MAG: molybdopterin-binding protein [Dehalococcoidia bacterium]
MRRVTVPVSAAQGLILIRALTLPTGERLPKGTVLDAPLIARLQAAGIPEVTAAAMAPDEVHEAEGSQRIARAAAGPGLVLGEPDESQVPFLATSDGLLRVAPATLAAFNRIPDVAVFTLFDRTVVRQGQVVGAAKALPLAIRRDRVEAAEQLGRERGAALWVAPFQPTTAVLLVRERLSPRLVAKFRQVASAKLASYGSQVIACQLLPDDPQAIAVAYRQAAAAGARLVLAAGGASADPEDAALVAVERAGGRLVRAGMPVFPGTQCWLATLGALTILAVASCGAVARVSLVDLLVPRLAAGDPLDEEMLASLGHGGLLQPDQPSRYPHWARERAL